MKKTAICLFTCWATLRVGAAEAEWLADMPKAQVKAKTENKMLLLNFTGSDWCPPCVKFRNEVLSKSQFVEYAKENLVLVEVDFPRKKPQAPELKKANADLKKKCNVSAFPTFVLLDGEGKEIGRQVGAGDIAPNAFIAKLDSWKKK